MSDQKPTYEELEGRLAEADAAIKALRSEQEIQENSRILLDTLDDFLFVIDGEGRILHANATAEKRLGYSVEELRGMRAVDFRPADQRDEAAAVLNEIMAGAASVCDMPLVAKDGTLIDVETRGVRGKWNGRDVLFGVARDVSERKRAERALRESERKYRALVEGSLQAIVVLQDDRVIVASQAAAEIAGLPLERLLDLTLDDVQPFMRPKDRAALLQCLANSLAGKPLPPREECRLVRPDGNELWLEAVVGRIEYKGKPAVQAVFVDITERKQMEASLRESEDRFFKAFYANATACAISELESGHIVEVNQAFLKLTGYARDEVVGHTPVELGFYPRVEDRLEMLRLLEQGSRSVKRTEAITQVKSGEVRHAEIFLEAIKLDAKPCIFATLVDITERRRAEEELQKAHDELERRVEERTARLAEANERLASEIEQRKRAEETAKEEKDRIQHYLDTAGVILVALDSDERVLLIDRKGREILKRKEAELLGENWFDTVIPQRDRDRVRQVFQNLMAGRLEAVEYYESPVLTKNGEERLIAWRNALLKDPSGKIIGTLSSGEDITERKRAEEQLQRKTAVLQAINDVFRETLTCDSEEQLGMTCLAVAERLSGSKCGFVGEVNDAGRFDGIAISKLGDGMPAKCRLMTLGTPSGTCRSGGFSERPSGKEDL
ncbi:MAG: PAS domain S-box protein [Planctomycetes bacterium]|nr:PAS domain S-box protein [Planctomycetota bacterium]